MKETNNLKYGSQKWREDIAAVFHRRHREEQVKQEVQRRQEQIQKQEEFQRQERTPKAPFFLYTSSHCTSAMQNNWAGGFNS